MQSFRSSRIDCLARLRPALVRKFVHVFGGGLYVVANEYSCWEALVYCIFETHGSYGDFFTAHHSSRSILLSSELSDVLCGYVDL